MALSNIVAEVRRLLEDEPFEDSLTAQSISSDTTLDVTDGTDWEEGDVGEFADGEQILVKSIAANVLTVKRGHNNTTAATQASGAVILKNPRYTYDQVSRAATQVADSLWPQVWERKTTTLTPAPSTAAVYDLPTDYEEFLNLAQARQGAITDVVYTWDVREVTDVPSGVATSTRGLRVLDWPRTDVAATLTYKAKVAVTTTDAQLERLISLGTAVFLLKTEAAIKADRVDENNRPRRMLNAAQFLEEQFELSKHSWRAERQLQSPPRRRFLRTWR